MRTILASLALSALALVPRLVGKPLGSTWIELTYPFNNETIYWPGDPTFKLTTTFDNYTSDGYYLFMSVISAPEHGGTHLDAPRHYAKGKWSTDEIPLDRLIGPAIKIDISEKATQNADAQLTPSDLQAWEEKYGKIPDDAILLVFTNWGRRWPNRTTYLGTDTANSSLMHFPGIHPNASRWLVKNRKIKLVGIDTASIDYGQSKFYETHQILYKENIPGLESVANMDKLPAKGFTLYTAPMFITGGSGGPCRIFAHLDENDDKDRITSGGIRLQGEVTYIEITLPLLLGFLKFLNF